MEQEKPPRECKRFRIAFNVSLGLAVMSLPAMYNSLSGDILLCFIFGETLWEKSIRVEVR